MEPPVEASRLATAADRSAIEELQLSGRTSIEHARGGYLWCELDRTVETTATDTSRSLDGNEDNHVAFLGTLDGQPVGYAIVASTQTAAGERIALINELFVMQAAREVGVGEAIMEEIETWAKNHKCVGIDAVALPGDRATKNFFESHGLVARAIRVHRQLGEPAPEPI